MFKSIHFTIYLMYVGDQQWIHLYVCYYSLTYKSLTTDSFLVKDLDTPPPPHCLETSLCDNHHISCRTIIHFKPQSSVLSDSSRLNWPDQQPADKFTNHVDHLTPHPPPSLGYCHPSLCCHHSKCECYSQAYAQKHNMWYSLLTISMSLTDTGMVGGVNSWTWGHLLWPMVLM